MVSQSVEAPQRTVPLPRPQLRYFKVTYTVFIAYAIGSAILAAYITRV